MKPSGPRSFVNIISDICIGCGVIGAVLISYVETKFSKSITASYALNVILYPAAIMLAAIALAHVLRIAAEKNYAIVLSAIDEVKVQNMPSGLPRVLATGYIVSAWIVLFLSTHCGVSVFIVAINKLFVS